MATNNKTVGKTTKTVGKTTNNLMKGGIHMTIKDALLYTLKDANDYNNYRKDNKKSYTLITKEEYAQSAKKVLTEDNMKELIQSWITIRKYQEKLRKHIHQERTLNRIYGKEYTHPNERQQDNTKLHPTTRQKLIQAEQTQQAATAKTNDTINRALYKQQLEQDIIDNM